VKETTETIEVIYKSNPDLGTVRINKEDFDADLHEKVVDAPKKPAVNKESKYAAMKMDELKAELAAREIEFKTSASKGELVDMLDESDESGYKASEGDTGSAGDTQPENEE